MIILKYKFNLYRIAEYKLNWHIGIGLKAKILSNTVSTILVLIYIYCKHQIIELYIKSYIIQIYACMHIRLMF